MAVPAKGEPPPTHISRSLTKRTCSGILAGSEYLFSKLQIRIEVGNMRLHHRPALFFLLTVLCTLTLQESLTFAGDPRFNRHALKGFEAFHVKVERLAPEIEQDGLSALSIQKDVETQLRSAGIKTVPEKESFDIPGNPYLYVNSHVLKLHASKEYVYSINLSFNQNVYSVREPKIILGAGSWSSANVIGITGSLTKIRTSIKNQVDIFIEAYRFANPGD
jgi:hypothetical protein